MSFPPEFAPVGIPPPDQYARSGLLSDREGSMVMLSLSLLGVALLSTFIRERIPVDKFQLRAMDLGSCLLLTYYSLSLAFITCCSFLVLDSSKHRLSICTSMGYVTLTGFLSTKLCALAFLIERTRTVCTQRQYPRRRDDWQFLLHSAVILLPLVGATIWSYMTIKSYILDNRYCTMSLPFGAVIFTFGWIEASGIYLLSRSCYALSRLRLPEARAWTPRFIFAMAMNIILVTTCFCIMSITKGRRSSYYFVIFAIAENIASCVSGHYLIAWCPLYKKVRNVDSAWRHSSLAMSGSEISSGRPPLAGRKLKKETVAWPTSDSDIWTHGLRPVTTERIELQVCDSQKYLSSTSAHSEYLEPVDHDTFSKGGSILVGVQKETLVSTPSVMTISPGPSPLDSMFTTSYTMDPIVLNLAPSQRVPVATRPRVGSVPSIEIDMIEEIISEIRKCNNSISGEVPRKAP